MSAVPIPQWLLLHGYTGHADCWGQVIARLPRGGPSAWPVTLYGHDFDKVPEAKTTFEDEIDRIAGFIDDRLRTGECQGPFGVCGYSLGGRLALGLAIRHPRLVASAVLIGSHAGLETAAARQERAASDAKWQAIAEREGGAAFFREWAKQPLFASQTKLSLALRADHEARRNRHSGAAMALAMQSLGLAQMPNFWPDLPKVKAPVHLVVGALDAKFREVGSRMLALLPYATLTVVEGAGHNVVLERPEAIAAILEQLP